MDVESLALMGTALALVGFTMYLANIAVLNPARVPPLRGLLGLLTLMMTLLGVFTMTAIVGESPDHASGALLGAGVAGLGGAFSAALLVSSAFRVGLSRIFGSRYNPESPVHLTAMVLTALLLSYTVVNLIAGGGVQALADSIEESGISAGETVFQSALWLLAALLGVGLFLRRSPADTLSRLGLGMPRLMDVVVGLGSGLLLYGVVLAGSLLWVMFASPDFLSEQSAVSAALAASVTSVPEALVLSLPVAIGEETFFRGALQPVFGIVPTALYFTALHAQYGFTPALLSLFVVALGFGVLAKRRGTTTAILAHFMFNFVQLMLALMASSMLPAGGS
ncbi:MAG: CPBP family intramembrane glutamic endopeptidase [Anaerolineae bacterium]